MATVPDAERQRWAAEAELAVESFLALQASTVASRLRAGGESKAAPGWWDDGDDWDGTLAAVLTPPLAGAMAAGGQALFEGWEPGDGPAELAATHASLVNASTLDRVRSSVEDVGKAQAATLLEAKAHAGRASVVANTAVTEATWKGLTAAARESGSRAEKTWSMSVGHAGVDDCDFWDGKTLPMDEPFGWVDSPPLHPNCQCSMTVELVEEAKRLTAGELRGAAVILRRRATT